MMESLEAARIERRHRLQHIVELWTRQLETIEHSAVTCFQEQDLVAIAHLLQRKRHIEQRIAQVESLLSNPPFA